MPVETLVERWEKRDEWGQGMSSLEGQGQGLGLYPERVEPLNGLGLGNDHCLLQSLKVAGCHVMRGLQGWGSGQGHH